MRELGVALLGCGDIGAADAASIARAQGARLIACFDPIRRLAEDVACLHGAEAMGSVEATIGRADADVIVVASPQDTHEALARTVVAAGKHLLLEKPLAANLPAAVRIAHLARHAQGRVGVLLPLRHEPGFLQARAAIVEGLIGDVTGALSTYLINKPRSYYFGGYSNRASSTWRMSKSRAGGGILIMNLFHHLDAVRAMLAAEAQLVHAATVQSKIAPEIEDLAAVVVRFDEVVATFVGSSSVVSGPGEEIRIWGTAGQTTVLPEGRTVSLLDSEVGSRPDPGADAVDARTAAIERFVADSSGAAASGSTVEDALAVQAIVAAAYRSARTGIGTSPRRLLEEVTER